MQEEEDYFAHEDEVIAKFYEQINDSLSSGKYQYVIADATHNTKKARNYMLDRINAKTITTDLETCIKQNNKRFGGACVPEEAIRKMYQYFEQPYFNEKYEYGGLREVDNK